MIQKMTQKMNQLILSPSPVGPSNYQSPSYAGLRGPPRSPSTFHPSSRWVGGVYILFSRSGMLLGEGKRGGGPEIALILQMAPKGVGGLHVSDSPN